MIEKIVMQNAYMDKHGHLPLAKSVYRWPLCNIAMFMRMCAWLEPDMNRQVSHYEPKSLSLQIVIQH